ncbi:hypothetical protein NFI96_013731, partial [Prochilodus magdalenae]
QGTFEREGTKMERFQISPPPKFDFTRPEEWPKWIKRFERFRIASGLELQAEENQVNTLIYTMGDEAEDIITSLQLTEIEASQYNMVKNKLNAHFVVRRNVIFEWAKFNQRQQEQAPEQYQKRMSRILEGLDGVLCQMDNFLVFGDTQAQHDTRLSAVLERLQEAVGTSTTESIHNIKKELSSPPGLALYNSKAEAVVSADASSFRLGAVLPQKQGEGYLKPVAYSSRALTETEKRYAQIEKEALAITWACEWFSDYLVGIRFHVETDHKPLVPLLGSKSLDELPPRIQRLRMRLLAFCYSISHVAGKELATADVLSRAPLRESEQPKQEEKIKLYVNMVMSTLPATEKRLQEIRKCQKGDEILSQVKRYCNEGWPNRSKIDRANLPYAQVEEELTVEDGLLLKGWQPRSPTGIAQLSCQWADSSGQRFQSSLNPGWTDIVKLKEEEQKMRQRSRVHFNKRHRVQQLTTLTPGDHIWIKDTEEKGTVISQANTPRSYVIDSPRGILRRNHNHLVTTPVPPAEQTTSPEPDLPADQPVSPARAEQIPVQPGSPMTRACYPARERQPPGYLKDFVLK